MKLMGPVASKPEFRRRTFTLGKRGHSRPQGPCRPGTAFEATLANRPHGGRGACCSTPYWNQASGLADDAAAVPSGSRAFRRISSSSAALGALASWVAWAPRPCVPWAGFAPSSARPWVSALPAGLAQARSVPCGASSPAASAVGSSAVLRHRYHWRPAAGVVSQAVPPERRSQAMRGLARLPWAVPSGLDP